MFKSCYSCELCYRRTLLACNMFLADSRSNIQHVWQQMDHRPHVIPLLSAWPSPSWTLHRDNGCRHNKKEAARRCSWPLTWVRVNSRRCPSCALVVWWWWWGSRCDFPPRNNPKNTGCTAAEGWEDAGTSVCKEVRAEGAAELPLSCFLSALCVSVCACNICPNPSLCSLFFFWQKFSTFLVSFTSGNVRPRKRAKNGSWFKYKPLCYAPGVARREKRNQIGIMPTKKNKCWFF